MTTIVDRTLRRLAQIEAEDAVYNSFLRLYPETAEREAEAADARREQGTTIGALDGRTVAVKDNLAVSGAPWTAGIGGRSKVIAQGDSTVVTRMRAAGAIILGSTNMEEAALGSVTDNPTFGRCINPLMPGYTPGGSSGGSGAAVAAGFADLTLGTDTMGSVRIPAAYCGVFGLKPTYGLVGMGGVVPLAPLLDTVGPLARDVNLLWPTVQALAGIDDRDPNSRPAPKDWHIRPARVDLSGLTFGVLKQIMSVDCQPAIEMGLDRARKMIKDLGGAVIDIDLDGWVPDQDRRAGLLIIEAEGAVALADLMDVDGALSPHLQGLLDYGRRLSSSKLVQAYGRARMMAALVDRAFLHVDGLLLPSAPQRAFPHGSAIPTDQAAFMPLANFSGCPAIALPVPLAGEGLPASVQILGPRWSEARLTHWAETLAPALADL
ncbi:MAG: amidase [Pseudomonadota bacterium]